MIEDIKISFKMSFNSVKQTISTLGIIILIFTFPIHLLILAYILLFTRYYFVTLIICVWLWYDRKASEQGASFNDCVRKLPVWKWIAQYFPIRLKKTVELSSDRKYLFCLHPHGLLSVSHFLNFATDATRFSELFPGIRPHIITLRYIFFQPFIRQTLLNLGVCDSSEKSIDYVLSNKRSGDSVVLVVGGVREVLYSSPNTMILNLKKRKGFIRLALKHGVSLVPVISFGENDVFRGFIKANWYRRFQNKLIDILGIPLSPAIGRGYLPFVPFKNPVTTVVGKPMQVERILNPSEEQIDFYHKKYINLLTELYQQNQDKYNHKHIKLQII